MDMAEPPQVLAHEPNGITLSVCLRCRDGHERAEDDTRGGTRFARSILAARAGQLATHTDAPERSLPPHTIRGVRCMSQCKRPCTVAFSAPGRFTYLFGDLDPADHAADVLAAFVAYANAPEGFLPRDARPAPLQAGILGRIPPLGSCHETVTVLAGSPAPEFTAQGASL
ncbi:MAG: DUF1636 domain-containing protein [Pseudomonadota bacterium]